METERAHHRPVRDGDVPRVADRAFKEGLVPSTPEARMKTILLVESDSALRLDLASGLGGDDEHVLALDTLDAARDALEAFMPDLVVSSVELTDGSGYELCRSVRMQYGNHVAVVLLRPESAEPMTALLSGADDVVTTPVNAAALRARCARLLRRMRRHSLA